MFQDKSLLKKFLSSVAGPDLKMNLANLKSVKIKNNFAEWNTMAKLR